ncbi:MAG: hypothetical protein GY706_13465 [Bacteroides sp.]|nr:hypothetical protein [Bacteroides sp.]
MGLKPWIVSFGGEKTLSEKQQIAQFVTLNLSASILPEPPAPFTGVELGEDRFNLLWEAVREIRERYRPVVSMAQKRSLCNRSSSHGVDGATR